MKRKFWGEEIQVEKRGVTFHTTVFWVLVEGLVRVCVHGWMYLLGLMYELCFVEKTTPHMVACYHMWLC